MKNAVFWDVESCRNCVNRRFVGTYILNGLLNDAIHVLGPGSEDYYSLKMEAIRSSET
jgi:hypothetical protein